MLPGGCRLAWRPCHDAPPQGPEELRISPTGQACAVLPATEPGVYGLFWEWGDHPLPGGPPTH
ncbi:hypothetical protein [Kitasatospora arboriphila]|uniref:Uncharacterized protein n=1 Tax=Kitasatospora arboriphila TaxID=258052 RepID=A0ABN1U5A0_9ACTN